MAYAILIISVCIYVYNWDKIEAKNFYYKYAPIFVVLFLFVGLQYNVGTDYHSYITYATNDELGLFKLNQVIEKKEYLFALVVKVSQLSNHPQTIFFISSFIQNIFLMLIMKKLYEKDFSLLNCFLLYFGLSLCFFNQFNGIRQFISIYIFIYAFLLLLDNIRNIYGWILLFVAPFFHLSSIFIIVLTLIYFLMLFLFEKFNVEFDIKKIYFILVFFMFAVYFFDFNSVIFFLIDKLDLYQTYLTSSYVTKMSIPGILTKLFKLIVLFYSIYKIEISLLNSYERKMMLFSLISTLVMILSFSSTLIWRFYLFFDFFIIFVVLLFFKYNASKKEKKIIMLYLYAFLLVKIILIPKGEYLYRSILGR